MTYPTKIDWDKINQPELVLQRFPSRRSQVFSAKGIVSASQPLAVEAGLEILRKGGNAGTPLRIHSGTARRMTDGARSKSPCS